MDQRVALQRRREQSSVLRGKPQHADASLNGAKTGRWTDRTRETRRQTTELPAGRQQPQQRLRSCASLRCPPAHLLLLFHAPPIHLTLSSYVLHHPSILPHCSLVFIFDLFLSAYHHRASSSRPPTGLQTLCCMMLEGDFGIKALFELYSCVSLFSCKKKKPSTNNGYIWVSSERLQNFRFQIQGEKEKDGCQLVPSNGRSQNCMCT